MRNWAWVLPCWVWKYFFAQFPREKVLLDGRPRLLIRLDEEFALVYDPQSGSLLPKSIQLNQNTPATQPTRVFVGSKSRAQCSTRRGGSKFMRTYGLHHCFGVGTQHD